MKLLKNLVLFAMVTTLTGCGSSNSAKKILNSGRDKNPSGTEITAEDFGTFYQGYLTESENHKALTEWYASSTKLSSDNYFGYYKVQSESTLESFSVLDLSKKEIYSKSSSKGEEKVQITVDDKMVDINRKSENEFLMNAKNSYEYSYDNIEYKDGSYKDLSSSKSCDKTDEDIWENTSASDSMLRITGNYSLVNLFYSTETQYLKKNNNTYYIMVNLGLADIDNTSYSAFTYDAYVKIVTNSKGLITSAYTELINSYSYTDYQNQVVTYSSTEKQAIVLEYKTKSYKLDTSKGYSCPKEQ